jgi:hypothetical protein
MLNHGFQPYMTTLRGNYRMRHMFAAVLVLVSVVIGSVAAQTLFAMLRAHTAASVGGSKMEFNSTWLAIRSQIF